MFRVEYLILVDTEKAACNTVDALEHLIQSDPDMVISSGSELIYKAGTKFSLQITKGTTKPEKEGKQGGVYFDLTLACDSTKELTAMSETLRSIRRVINPILVNTTALQVLWDDISTHYASKAYPVIAKTENLMRKLITKFMYINVGLSWTEDRVPDDAAKSINPNNTDSTYLHNVDFIVLKDVLLSEKYVKDRDALIHKLKSSDKKSFKRDEISSLIPTSNWERFFSKQVKSEAAALESLWTKLYELRCKVAHNKSFSQKDLADCKQLSSTLDTIIQEAISKLDGIHIEKEEADDIVEEVVSSTSRADQSDRKQFLREYRRVESLVYDVSTPFQPKNSKSSLSRILLRDLRLLRDNDIISFSQYKVLMHSSNVRNRMIHKINDTLELENWEALTAELIAIGTILLEYLDAKPQSIAKKSKG